MQTKSLVVVSLAWALLGLTLQAAGEDQKGSLGRPLFRVGVDTVFVKVAVTDPLNRYVVGLEKSNFKVFEEKVEQDIAHFSQQAAPISVGILFDMSGSMKSNNNINSARSALTRFMQSSNPEDEFFLINFNQSTTLTKDFTSDPSAIENGIAFRQPGGRTALYDAVYRGLEEMRKGKNEKKALILITDGEDNSSRYTVQEVKEFARESDVQIYGVGEEGKLGYGRSEIQNIVGMTGGRAFFPNSFNELDYYIDLIHAELRNQYVLGYVPTNRNHDGKWRRIRVRLDAPQGLPKLLVHAKEGYYAPRN
jgi:Ca-activated chloride channel family protein